MDDNGETTYSTSNTFDKEINQMLVNNLWYFGFNKLTNSSLTSSMLTTDASGKAALDHTFGYPNHSSHFHLWNFDQSMIKCTNFSDTNPNLMLNANSSLFYNIINWNSDNQYSP